MQLSRLMQAHELIIDATREASWTSALSGDGGIKDLLISHVLRVNEFQVWFVSEQLANTGIATDPALLAARWSKLTSSARLRRATFTGKRSAAGTHSPDRAT
jgi:hypothetical protein